MWSRSWLLAAAILLVPAVGCLTPSENVPQGSIAFETIDQGQNSGIEETDTLVVRDKQALVALWEEHAPEQEAPEVNFQKRMVLAIFKGQSPNGCHGAEIENVTGQGDHVLVEGIFFVMDGVACHEAITYPFHIVETARHDAEVRFDVPEQTREPNDGEADSGNETDDPSGEKPAEDGSYACREPGEQEDELTEAERVALETIEEGDRSGIREACVTVAANETAWRDLWRDHQGSSSAEEQRPEVDFEDNLVVAIFKGQSPDACHGAEIEEATRDGDDLVVHGVFYVVEGQACAEVVTYPFHIAELEPPEGKIVFDVQEEIRQA